jgi:hypothetical protein
MSMSHSRNQHLTVDTALSKSTPEVRSLAMWAFILVVAIVAIAALVWDASLTADQRIQVFLQSGVYP